MNCPKCGKAAPDGALFCTGCGCRLNNLVSDTSETNANDETMLEQGTSETAEPAEIIPVADDIEQTESAASVEVPYADESPVPVYEAPEIADIPANNSAAAFENDVKTSEHLPNAPYFSVEPTDTKKEKDKKTSDLPVKPLSVWSYIWREFIFIIPVVNIISLFVFAFAEGINKNSRSFARSKLVYALIITLLLIAGAILVYAYRSTVFAWLKTVAEWVGNLEEL